MEHLFKAEVPEDTEFERLLTNYREAKRQLESYLYRENVKLIYKDEAASGD